MKTPVITDHALCVLFGGTFDPVHKGHIHVIDTVFRHKEYTHLFCVPTSHNPLKTLHPSASTQDRFAMLSIACESYPHVTVLDYELHAKGNTYTIDTVRHIMRTYHLVQNLGLIVGEDVVKELSQWKEIDALQKLVTLIVIARPRVQIQEKEKQFLCNFNVRYLHTDTLVDIQASQLRKDRTLLKNSVPPEIWNYIHARGLYT